MEGEGRRGDEGSAVGERAAERAGEGKWVGGGGERRMWEGEDWRGVGGGRGRWRGVGGRGWWQEGGGGLGEEG